MSDLAQVRAAIEFLKDPPRLMSNSTFRRALVALAQFLAERAEEILPPALPAATDQDKLRAAIKTMRAWAEASFRRHGPELDPLVLLICDAAESTLPKTKIVRVWHLEIFDTETDERRIAILDTKADAERAMLAATNSNIVCKRVTGPHEHEVPA